MKKIAGAILVVGAANALALSGFSAIIAGNDRQAMFMGIWLVMTILGLYFLFAKEKPKE